MTSAAIPNMRAVQFNSFSSENKPIRPKISPIDPIQIGCQKKPTTTIKIIKKIVLLNYFL